MESDPVAQQLLNFNINKITKICNFWLLVSLLFFFFFNNFLVDIHYLKVFRITITIFKSKDMEMFCLYILFSPFRLFFRSFFHFDIHVWIQMQVYRRHFVIKYFFPAVAVSHFSRRRDQRPVDYLWTWQHTPAMTWTTLHCNSPSTGPLSKSKVWDQQKLHCSLSVSCRNLKRNVWTVTRKQAREQSWVDVSMQIYVDDKFIVLIERSNKEAEDVFVAGLNWIFFFFFSWTVQK